MAPLPLLREERMMAVEAIELVVTALTAGAVAGVKDTATSAAKDAYGALVQAARGCVGRNRDDAESSVVEDHAADPRGRREVLVTALTAAGVLTDEPDVTTATIHAHLTRGHREGDPPTG